jgi:hypothetical protein
MLSPPTNVTSTEGNVARSALHYGSSMKRGELSMRGSHSHR